MTARNLLTLLREKGVQIRTSGADRLVIDAPKGTITPQLREELAAALEDPAAYTPGGHATAINRDLSAVSRDPARLTAE